MAQDIGICSDCKYYHEQLSECRRYPPIVDITRRDLLHELDLQIERSDQKSIKSRVDKATVFPVTTLVDWCGEWQERE